MGPRGPLEGWRARLLHAEIRAARTLISFPRFLSRSVGQKRKRRKRTTLHGGNTTVTRAAALLLKNPARHCNAGFFMTNASNNPAGAGGGKNFTLKCCFDTHCRCEHCFSVLTAVNLEAAVDVTAVQHYTCCPIDGPRLASHSHQARLARARAPCERRSGRASERPPAGRATCRSADAPPVCPARPAGPAGPGPRTAATARRTAPDMRRRRPRSDPRIHI